VFVIFFGVRMPAFSSSSRASVLTLFLSVFTGKQITFAFSIQDFLAPFLCLLSKPFLFFCPQKLIKYQNYESEHHIPMSRNIFFTGKASMLILCFIHTGRKKSYSVLFGNLMFSPGNRRPKRRPRHSPRNPMPSRPALMRIPVSLIYP